ncbi:unnamed protein product [Periconia digitata]|uniref:Uncharacterized protein n=1 Tax=Periconia digitata TaxID=1303443 RepID=A0A9W4UIK1_9PLEO|nr:unnamed protein product [Periconia digitata]
MVDASWMDGRMLRLSESLSPANAPFSLLIGSPPKKKTQTCRGGHNKERKQSHEPVRAFKCSHLAHVASQTMLHLAAAWQMQNKKQKFKSFRCYSCGFGLVCHNHLKFTLDSRISLFARHGSSKPWHSAASRPQSHV